MNRCKYFYTLLLGLWFFSACTPMASDSDTSEPEKATIPPTHVFYEGNSELKQAEHIVLVSGDEEYRSEEALPQLGKILAQQHGFDCTVLFAQHPDQPGFIDPNFTKNIPGLDKLKEADLMVLFTRFRDLPSEQMQHFSDYFMAGKPVVAIRTATHAFQTKDSTSQWKHWSNFHEEDGPWDGGFGRLVLGEHWHTHHGHHKHQSSRGLIAESAQDHPIARGLAETDIWGPTDVYGVRLPLPGDAFPIVLGQVMNRVGAFDETDPFFGMRATDDQIATQNPAAKTDYDPNDPMMPIAWTKSYQLPNGQEGQAFTSTIGAATDLLSEGVRRLLVNACYHLMELEVPEEASVKLVGSYEPSPYSFHDDAHWVEKNLQVKDFQ
ncbi:MAG: hypothetical protein AAF206_01085 [Bacteroidota bacterium]